MGNLSSKRGSGTGSHASTGASGPTGSSAAKHAMLTSTSPSTRPKKVLAPAQIVEDSDFECPICFNNYAALNTAFCCKQFICTECYLGASGTKAPCPFCNEKQFIVDYVTATLPDSKKMESSNSGVCSAHHDNNSENSPHATPQQDKAMTSAEKRQREKSIYIPLATSADRKEIEEEVRRCRYSESNSGFGRTGAQTPLTISRTQSARSSRSSPATAIPGVAGRSPSTGALGTSFSRGEDIASDPFTELAQRLHEAGGFGHLRTPRSGSTTSPAGMRFHPEPTASGGANGLMTPAALSAAMSARPPVAPVTSLSELDEYYMLMKALQQSLEESQRPIAADSASSTGNATGPLNHQQPGLPDVVAGATTATSSSSNLQLEAMELSFGMSEEEQLQLALQMSMQELSVLDNQSSAIERADSPPPPPAETAHNRLSVITTTNEFDGDGSEEERRATGAAMPSSPSSELLDRINQALSSPTGSYCPGEEAFPDNGNSERHRERESDKIPDDSETA